MGIALGILITELAAPAYRNRFIPFRNTPSWVNLSSCDDLISKFERTKSAHWGASTDFGATMELVLQVCVQHRLKAHQIPDPIVFSDMQFNEACSNHSNSGDGRRLSNWETHHERIVRRFTEACVCTVGEQWPVPCMIY